MLNKAFDIKLYYENSGAAPAEPGPIRSVNSARSDYTHGQAFNRKIIDRRINQNR